MIRNLDALRAALAQGGWRADGTAAWTTLLRNGAAQPVAARVGDGWLRVEAALGAKKLPSWPELLERSGALPRAVRPALARDGTGALAARLVADFAIDEGDDWAEVLAGTLAGIRSAAEVLQRAAGAEVAEGGAGPASAAALGRLEGSLREGGWNVAERTEHEIAVALGAEGANTTVRGTLLGTALRLFAPLAPTVPTGEARVAAALALFLLRLSHAARSVRPLALRSHGKAGIGVGWEAWLPADTGSPGLERALAALTVVCRHSAREVKALSDPHLSDRYVSQSGARPH